MRATSFNEGFLEVDQRAEIASSLETSGRPPWYDTTYTRRVRESKEVDDDNPH